ncbi:MAG: orotidine-5'-phosphate decarboxylase [Atopobiaceae bacterium]|nr:orotidine-5'-phosphate decarboxylase [Atopobiaceae bacterium]
MRDLTEAAEKVIVALDCSADEARILAEKLEGRARWLKVGMTLFYEAGPQIVSLLKEMGFSIFLDLKLHDIPHQVEGAAASAVASGADILSVHSLGGTSMVQAAVRGAKSVSTQGRSDAVKIIGITVLTSMDEQALESVGVSGGVESEVKGLARLAYGAGAHGIVCSPQEASSMRELLGPDALIVTPGVRMASDDVGDQRRVASPGAAIASGASMIVVGRPVTAAQDPASAFDAICHDIVELAQNAQ